MRTAIIASVLALYSSAAFAADSVYQAKTPVTLVIEGLVLGRDGLSGDSYTQPVSSLQLAPGDLAPGVGGGVRATAEFPVDAVGPLGTGTIQIGGFYALGFNAGGVIDAGSNSLFINYGSDVDPGSDEISTDPHQDAYILDISQDTSIGGAEVNFVSMPAGGEGVPGFFAGASFLHFGEDFDAAIQDDASPSGYDESFTIGTTNNLVGGQVGVTGFADMGNGVKIGGRVAGGLYANFVTQERDFSGAPNVSNPSFSDSVDDVVFAQSLELSPRVAIDLGNNVELTAGGMLLWLNGVSEASPQFMTVTDQDHTDVGADGSVLFYGGSIGLKIKLN